MLKIHQSIKNKPSIYLLILIGVAFSMMVCSCKFTGGNATGSKDKSGRVIVLIGDFVDNEHFGNLSAYVNQAAKSKEIVLARINAVQSKEDYMRELANMHNRAEQLNHYIFQEIDKQGWDKQQDEFVLMGFHEQGLAALEAAEELRNKINLTKVIVVAAPLCGYDFHSADYGLSWGAVGRLIAGMSQATLGRNSTVIEELTPGSTYLKQRHAFIESQTGEKDLKIYIADASMQKLCLSAESSSKQQKIDQEVEKLFDKVAKDIREKYGRKNPNDLPGVEEYMYLRRFLEKTDRQGFYTYYKYLNGGQDHDGSLSVATQRAAHISNSRVQRGSFDSYSGTLFIPYKELKDLKPLGLFGENEFTLNNTKLYDALLRFIVD